MARRAYDVAGKVALITGGAQGIGLALARTLHARGAAVVLLDRDGAAAAQAAEGLGGRSLEADVRDRGAMAAAVAEVGERWGGPEVVVANAGIGPPAATLRTIDPDDFDRVLAINLTGVFNTVRPAIEPVIDRRGHIVVVSSVAAFSPGAGGSPYMISKAAVEQLGRALRIELSAHRASAGVAYFGVVSTAMTRTHIDEDPIVRHAERRLPPPLRRRITPEQAGTVIADGIARRAARTIAPTAWAPYSLGRGAVNVVLDRLIAGHPETHATVREIEARTIG